MTQAPTIVRIEGVSKRFVVRKDNSLKERIVSLGRVGKKHRREFWALQDVSVDIKAGTTVGLIGHNGSGKSTLLKVIGGIIDPTGGTVERRGRIAALLELGAGFHPDLTGRENVYLNASILGLSKEQTDARFDDILAFSGIGDFINTQVKFYSSGMYVRLAFSVAVHTDPDLLLVDEVLAVGDEAFQRKCLDKIRSFQQEGRTIILVTHSLGQVTELCDRAILLNKGNVVFDGDPREAVAEFRDILEDRRQADLATAPKEAAPAHNTVTEVTVCAAGRNEQDDIRAGDDLKIRVTLSAEKELENWVCAIQIDSALGQVIYGTTSKRMGKDLGVLRGQRAVEFTLKDVRFGGGKYFINASLMDFEGRHLHDFPQAASFNVTDHALSAGVLYAEPVLADLG
ncbi:ABC transporter ATP-binding protein [Mycetocola sp. 2940]|uniref:ABC transporter ATP-binding protein n=1 Tax=Mycetocola sp. 2940 TaxID=3156452 RepID=UPI0033908892